MVGLWAEPWVEKTADRLVSLTVATMAGQLVVAEVES